MTSSIDHKNANQLLARMALGILIFVIFAFAIKSIVHPERLARYTPLVIVHAATMTGWLALLYSQASLAAKGDMSRHRAFGKWSPLLVAAVVISGLTVSWNLAQEFQRYEVFVGNIGTFVIFVPLYLAAILFARTHRGSEHRQAMLIGTLATLGPAYSRIMDVLDWPLFAAVPIMFVVTFALPIWIDRAARGSVARPTWWMLAYFFVVQVITAVGVFSLAPPPQ